MAEYIEREVVKAAVRKRLNNSLIIGWLISIINEIPAADVAPVVHGRWYWAEDGHCKCSVCGQYATVKRLVVKTNYCPNCGASMDGE